MKTQILIAWLAVLCIEQSAANAQVKASVECMASGTRVNGTKASKPFSEKIQVESQKEAVAGKDGKLEEWGISKSELVSDGEKQKPSLVVSTSDYAVLLECSNSWHRLRTPTSGLHLHARPESNATYASSQLASSRSRRANVC